MLRIGDVIAGVVFTKGDGKVIVGGEDILSSANEDIVEGERGEGASVIIGSVTGDIAGVEAKGDITDAAGDEYMGGATDIVTGDFKDGLTNGFTIDVKGGVENGIIVGLTGGVKDGGDGLGTDTDIFGIGDVNGLGVVL